MRLVLLVVLLSWSGWSCTRWVDVGPDGGGDGGRSPGGDGGGYDDGPRGDNGGDAGPQTFPGTWVLIDVSGTPFTMGSPDTELGRSTDEAEHDVTLTRNFWIMTTEITQQQFQDVMGYNPAEFNDCGPDCPVETVNWHEVAACTNELSRLEGLAACYECVGTAPDTIVCAPSGSYERAYDCPGYRLPTEAEWEYAARGGTTTATYNGNLLDPNATLDNGTCDAQAKLEPIAWWCGAVGADDLTHPVSGKAPNSYGLYDMLGNVWEWCHDWYGVYPGGAQTDPTGPPSGSYRVLRGGSSYHTARLARAACRLGTFPGSRASYDGARLVRSVL